MPQPLQQNASRAPFARNRPDVLMVGFVGGTGGASVLMRELATALARRGMRSRIAVPAWDSTRSYADDCRERGIQVDRTPWLQEREPRALSYLDAARVALRFRASIVHYHLCTNVMPERYVAAARWLGARPAFVTLHDPYDEPAPGSPAARRWAHAAPRLFDKVICVSRTGRERQLRYGLSPGDVQLIYNGIDVERFGRGRGERARARLGLEPTARLILVSSRIAPQKRPLDALAAFGQIAPEFPDAHLVLLGEGALQSVVREEAARQSLTDRVHLPGHEFEIPDWLAASSVWLMPTECEGFSLALLEAMAASCPIVTTACPGNDEILVDGQTGLLTAVGDVRAIAGALRRLLGDDRLRGQLGAEAKRVARQFSLERMVDAYVDVYRSRRGSPPTSAVADGTTRTARSASVNPDRAHGW